MRYKTDDLRIKAIHQVSPPCELHAELPLTDQAARVVYETRRDIHHILQGEDDRLLVVVGPCSVHDPVAALEYAGRLRKIREELIDDLLILMRVYFRSHAPRWAGRA